MKLALNDLFVELTDTQAKSIFGGVIVYAAPGIKPDGDPTTPPGNSSVTVPTTISVRNPQGKFKGFTNQSPGIVKNGDAYDFNPGTGTFTPVV